LTSLYVNEIIGGKFNVFGMLFSILIGFFRSVTS